MNVSTLVLWLLYFIFLIAGFKMGASEAGCWFFIVGQVVLFAGFWTRSLSSLAAFTFMYCLFFAVRPAYILLEGDYALLREIFRIVPDVGMLYRNLMWAAMGLGCLVGGGTGVALISQARYRAIPQRSKVCNQSKHATEIKSGFLLLLQLASLIVMVVLAKGGSLYGSALGAYVYDSPMVLQGVHVFALVVICTQTRASPLSHALWLRGSSGVLLLMFTILMRDVSIFRGFYMTGLMVAAVAARTVVGRKSTIAWLAVPIVLLLPAFSTIGQMRYQARDSLVEQLTERIAELFSPQAYWSIYDSSGDINIYDTFVAASESEPLYRPYLWSWAYVPLHLVPRKIWTGKPKSGVTQDISFANGAPYSPGIVGFFVLDGGRVWMLGCMGVLGGILAILDLKAARLKHTALRACLLAILAVNAMFLTRFYLWQYAYQVLYTAAPCVLLAICTQRYGWGAKTTVNVEYRGRSEIGAGSL